MQEDASRSNFSLESIVKEMVTRDRACPGDQFPFGMKASVFLLMLASTTMETGYALPGGA